MSEPIQSQPFEPEADSVVSGASAFLERAASRAGLDLDPEPQEATEAVRTPETGIQQATPFEAPQHRPDPDRANREFRERVDRRRAEAEQAARDQLLRTLAERLDQLPAGSPAAQGAAADDDPEPDMVTQTEEWYAWDRRQRRKEYEALLDERLKPVTGFFEEQQRREQAYLQRQQQEQQRRQWMGEMAGIGREATEIYAATPEGEGFGHRLALWFGHGELPPDPARGFAGAPAYDGAVARGMISQGIDPELARGMARANVHALQDFAVRHNKNPAVFIDAIMRAEMAAALQYAGVFDQPQSGQQEAQPQPAAPQTPAQRSIANLQQTAGAARGLAGAAVQGGNQTAGDDIGAIVRRGSFTPDDIKAIAKKKGWTMQHTRSVLHAEVAKLQSGKR